MDDIIEKARKYWRSAGRTGLAHYRAAEIAARRHRRIGIPNVAISAIVATSVFSTLSDNIDIRIKIFTGVIALVAAILAALQAFSNFGERAEKHKAAGARYGKVRRDIDVFCLQFAGGSDREAALSQLQEVGNALGGLAGESPTLSEAVYHAAKDDFDSTHDV